MLWEWWQRYRRLLMIAGSLLFLAGSVWLYTWDTQEANGDWPLSPVIVHGKEVQTQTLLQEDEDPTEEQNEKKKDESTPAAEKSVAPSPIYVDVKGQVQQPGLYELKAGMRVADAISLAGGSLPDADLDQINLAQPLTDGAAVVIPSKTAQSEDQSPPVRPLPGMLPPLSADATGVTGTGSTSSQADSRVNLNTATAEELMTLPGIGQAKAQAIIAYRTEKKPFRTPEDLKNISGIGDKMYERLKDRIRVQ
ncbi:helix-hairpin-helix domain-containing protein [Brevibacillus panacihumi]|uniref:helix-hairpin-helix domain-containing protein n=1 Tax=Brevibacillus panacihumi TaxID=497735 RepID=UPI003D056405